MPASRRGGGIAARLRRRRAYASRLLRVLRVLVSMVRRTSPAVDGTASPAPRAVGCRPRGALPGAATHRLRAARRHLHQVRPDARAAAGHPSIEHCNALFKLLDRVDPFPYAEVERTFREDLGRTPDEIFDRFERLSFAAASVGQVHRPGSAAASWRSRCGGHRWRPTSPANPR